MLTGDATGESEREEAGEDGPRDGRPWAGSGKVIAPCCGRKVEVRECPIRMLADARVCTTNEV